MVNQRKCSMCRNHYGLKAPSFKAHFCPFDNPVHIEKCQDGCLKVDNRRKRLAETKKLMYNRMKQNGETLMTCSSRAAKKLRSCTKCYLHGWPNIALRGGHLKVCPFMKCTCESCRAIDDRRNAGNEFTKFFRVQKNGEQKCSQFSSPNTPDSGFKADTKNSLIVSEQTHSNSSEYSMVYSDEWLMNDIESVKAESEENFAFDSVEVNNNSSCLYNSFRVLESLQYDNEFFTSQVLSSFIKMKST
jgi:hypothetical protein